MMCKRNKQLVCMFLKGCGTLELALVSADTHEELLSKPNGAYSQLICLQQIYKQQYKDTGGEAELYTPDNQSHTWRHRNELSSLL